MLRLLLAAVLLTVGCLYLATLWVDDPAGPAPIKIGPILTTRAAASPRLDTDAEPEPRAVTPAPVIPLPSSVAPSSEPAAAPASAKEAALQPVLAQDSAPPSEPARPRLRYVHAKGPPGCTGFRTYDAANGTYRGFDGLVHACRP